MKKVILLFLFCFIFSKNIYASEKVIVDEIECVDGDTFRGIINDEKETIRLLAIDTPETKYSTKLEDEPYAQEASEFTCNLLTNSKNIILEYDKKSKKTDKYGRVLGWIYADGIFLQKELIKKGYAKLEYVYDDYEYISELEEVEEKAKTDKLGIWSESTEFEKEKDEQKSTFDKIIDFVFEKIKELFEYIFKSIKNYINKSSKD